MTPTPTRSRATGRVTLADVAQLAGVSTMTVSRALRGERAVDKELVARVQAAADKLGYLPDPAARALASRHSAQVVVLVPLLSNALFVDVLEAVQRTLIEALILVSLVVLLFLQSWRAAIIPILAIPIALVGSFVLTYVLRKSTVRDQEMPRREATYTEGARR